MVSTMSGQSLRTQQMALVGNSLPQARPRPRAQAQRRALLVSARSPSDHHALVDANPGHRAEAAKGQSAGTVPVSWVAAGTVAVAAGMAMKKMFAGDSAPAPAPAPAQNVVHVPHNKVPAHLVKSMEGALSNNKKWAAAQEPGYFTELAKGQTPEFLWIGCADSRAPANTLLGMPPGSIFEQRNVGNMASHKDMNCMSVLEYGVGALGAKKIIVCGHTECGACKGALSMPHTTPGVVNLWIADLRETAFAHKNILDATPESDRHNTLAKLNVVRQVQNVCTHPTVQAAWEKGEPVSVHGCLYCIGEGLIKEIVAPITNKAEAAAFRDTLHSQGAMKLLRKV